MSAEPDVRPRSPRERRPGAAWAFWLAALLLLVLAGVGAVVVQRLPVTYSATSVIALRPLPTAQLNADGVSMIAHEYTLYLSGDRTVELGAQDARLGEVREDVSVAANQDPETSTIRVMVTAPSSATAVALANSIAKRGETRASNDKDVRAVQVSPAVASGVVAGPPRALYLAGLATATVLGLLALLYLRRTQDGARTS